MKWSMLFFCVHNAVVNAVLKARNEYEVAMNENSVVDVPSYYTHFFKIEEHSIIMYGDIGKLEIKPFEAVQ